MRSRFERVSTTPLKDQRRILSYPQPHSCFCVAPRVNRHHPLRSNPNNTTSWTSTRITSLLALIIAALTEIIRARVNNYSTANNALWADEFNKLVRDRALRIALPICLEVAEIAHVAVAVFWCAVFFVLRVDCR